MTDDQRILIEEHLNKKNIRQECIECGSPSTSISTRFYAMAHIEKDLSLSFGSSIPFACTICPECGHTRFFFVPEITMQTES